MENENCVEDPLRTQDLLFVYPRSDTVSPLSLCAATEHSEFLSISEPFQIWKLFSHLFSCPSTIISCVFVPIVVSHIPSTTVSYVFSNVNPSS